MFQASLFPPPELRSVIGIFPSTGTWRIFPDPAVSDHPSCFLTCLTCPVCLPIPPLFCDTVHNSIPFHSISILPPAWRDEAQGPRLFYDRPHSQPWHHLTHRLTPPGFDPQLPLPGVWQVGPPLGSSKTGLRPLALIGGTYPPPAGLRLWGLILPTSPLLSFPYS